MRKEIDITLSDPQYDLYANPAPLNLFLAGKGSGKSHMAGLISWRLISMFPKVKGFIGANTYDQLNTSTMTKILEVWSGMGIKEWDEKQQTGRYVIHKQPPKCFADSGNKYISYKNIITFWNGATIYLGSLDNAKAHEGKEFGWAFLDETKDSKEEDVKDTILSRLRQMGLFLNKEGLYDLSGTPINPLYILTSPAKVQWLNEWFDLPGYRGEIESLIFSDKTYFHKKTATKNIVISSTYHNQDNLPADYIPTLIASNPDDKVKMIVYGSPFARSGAEYITSFEETQYIQKFIYDRTKALHITFDFNIAPYNSCGIYQIYKVDKGSDLSTFKFNIQKMIAQFGFLYVVHGIGEIALKPPQNSAGKMCDEFKRRYENHKSGLYIYGDATGKNRNIAYEGFKHHYDKIEHDLYKYLSNDSNRVQRTNPANVKRRDFMNLLWEKKIPVIVLLDPCMKYTLEDILYCKVDPEGAKDPEKTKDPDTGEVYEKRGHFLDNLEYFICSAFSKYF